ncbi:MAG: hypothetical protein N2037_06100 [Acidimicrobiales bacterium]|nr:hypothetical protein [Acidimicrobiales bacterium]
MTTNSPPSTSTTTTARSFERALVGSAAAVAVTWLAIIALWEDAPFALTFDDAWYYFGIARNIAAGHGSTFDQLNPTNGYHPLWMWLCVLGYTFGLDRLSDLGAARALLAVQAVAWGVSLVLVARAVALSVRDWPRVRRSPGAPPGAAVWTVTSSLILITANPFVVKVFVNGMESGVAIVCYAALLYAAVRWQGGFVDGRLTRQFTVGLLLALTFLARTDAVFFIACFAIWCFAERLSSGKGSWVGIITLFAPPAVVASGYLLYNKSAFGTWVQISGLVKREPLTVSRAVAFTFVVVAAALIARSAFLRSHPVHRGQRRSGQARATSGSGSAAPTLATNTQPDRDDTRRHRRFPHAGALASLTGWYAAACILIVGYYSVLQNQQWLWYYAPVVLYGVVLLVLAVADFAEAALQQAPASFSPQRTLLPVGLIIGVPLVAALAILVGQFADPNLRSIQQANRAAGEWAKANLPGDAVIASWDAGVFGYFSHLRVVNLDGVVNSYDWYQATKRGPAAVAQFLACDGVAYLANHGDDIDGRDPDIDRFAREILGDEDPEVVYRLPFEYSGATVGSRGRDTDGSPLAVHIYALTAEHGSWPPQCPAAGN